MLRLEHDTYESTAIISYHRTYDPAEPAGAAGEAVVELSFNLVQVLTALRLLLLAMSTS